MSMSATVSVIIPTSIGFSRRADSGALLFDLVALPFLANYLISSKRNESLYQFFGQRDECQHAKFPALQLAPGAQWWRAPAPGRHRILGYDGFSGTITTRVEHPGSPPGEGQVALLLKWRRFVKGHRGD